MPKGYFYKTTRGDNTFICAKYANASELITVWHQSSGVIRRVAVDHAAVPDEFPTNMTSVGVVESTNDVGCVVDSVWRPGLTVNIPTALRIDNAVKHRAKKDLKVLIEKLHDVLMYVEPDSTGLQAHGHRIRELLILSCTEVENAWKYYMRLAGKDADRLSTNDYVKLNEPLKLHEYRVLFNSHPLSIPLQPFSGWSSYDPTKSLEWYDAYNASKHDKRDHFADATLKHCLNAVAANIVLFCVRYSPYELIDGNDICSNLVNEYFDVELNNPDFASFYLPIFRSEAAGTGAFASNRRIVVGSAWNITPFEV